MKTIEEKIIRICEYCNNRDECNDCPLLDAMCYGKESYKKHPEIAENHYNILFGNEIDNPYWERITQMADRQREKGISTYGQGLEQFTTPDALKRIDYIQEELIDALMYLEWLKEILKGDIENGTKEENA